MENEQFLVNTNCPINVLLQHVREKLGLSESELVDLCDEQGDLKMLFQSQHLQENAIQLLSPRETFIVCTVNCTSDGAFVSITPLVASPTPTSPNPTLQEVLQTQTESLEKTRVKQLRALEERKRSGETPAQTQSSQPVKSRGRAVHVDAPEEESHRRMGSKRNRN